MKCGNMPNPEPCVLFAKSGICECNNVDAIWWVWLTDGINIDGFSPMRSVTFMLIRFGMAAKYEHCISPQWVSGRTKMGGNMDYIVRTELFSRVPSSLFNTSLSQSVIALVKPQREWRVISWEWMHNMKSCSQSATSNTIILDLPNKHALVDSQRDIQGESHLTNNPTATTAYI